VLGLHAPSLGPRLEYGQRRGVIDVDRCFGQPTSLWTLGLAARVCFAQGWTSRVLSGEAIRLALKRLGVSWRRAKHWLTSPDPAYARKKKRATS